ncbi:Dynamin-like GTPase that mediates homotypic ER fusion [Conoideocrella luteorostrata]|uniref:Dynamin-like GTPase that mediates homotypic ER fusion n=1 Tax=Conoideocrella luteorostrata TaxID=1105319 RepID=A0AAJ0FXZ9_9HYPO|nr:Dynamin-like GTPase that mediates homotypic ER fusion [Conoideocrella luteorostrata]
MSETERCQTTKGIWMSKNKREESAGAKMAEIILVMDVEGTDGRERGEDPDFERKSALFAMATSEVLIVNIWEHQVGLAGLATHAAQIWEHKLPPAGLSPTADKWPFMIGARGEGCAELQGHERTLDAGACYL